MQPKFYTKQQTLGTEYLDTGAARTNIITDRYTDIILRCLDPEKDITKYELAKNTYDIIYNNIQYRNKDELTKPGGMEAKSLAGKPILLTSNNMFPLFTEDYYVSTKADGLRFMMMLSIDEHKARKDRGIIATEEMKFTHKEKRFIFFLDTKMNFWIIESANKIQDHLFLMDIDKCLVDGEILFFADNIVPYINKTTKQVYKYVLSINERNKNETRIPYIVFLAFDILFGPMNPSYEYERHVIKGIKLTETKYVNDTYTLKTEVKDTTLIFGSSSNMMGHKSDNRWNARNRRCILQQMFMNTFSPLHVQLKRIASIANFTILLSPFMNFNDVIADISPYQYSIDRYITEIDDQFKKVTSFSIKHLPGSGKPGYGLGTDGIILTPEKQDYLVDNWSLGNNKQYKWKPIEELTIDVKINSKDIKESEFVQCYTGNSSKPYTYKGSKILVSTENIKDILQSLKDPIIVECSYQNINYSNEYIFSIKKVRFDKEYPNAKLTVDSNLDQLVGPESEYDILDIVKNCRNYFRMSTLSPNTNNLINTLFGSKKYEEFNLCSLFSDESIKRINLIDNPIEYLTNNNNQEFINKMLDIIAIRMTGKNSGYELEARIDFDDNRDIEKVLIDGFLKNGYENKPMVRYYKEHDNDSYRITFVELGSNNLILQDISSKKNIKQVDTPKFLDDIYRKVSKFVMSLSIETILDDDYIIDLMTSDTITYESDILKDIIKNGIKSKFSNIILDTNNYKKFKEKKNRVQPPTASIPDTLTPTTPESSNISDEESIYLVHYAKILLKESKNQEIFKDTTKLVSSISEGLPIQGTFQYQNRHVINSASDYWSIEIIKYGVSKGFKSSYLDAFNNYYKGPNSENAQKTRIEIEYRPLEYYSDILKYIGHYGYKTNPEYIEKFIKRFDGPKDYAKLSDLEVYETLKKLLDKELRNISKMDPKDILEDYLKLIFKVLYSIYY